MKEFIPCNNATEKVNVTIRVDLTTLEEIDKLANNTGISRNEFINQCIEYALTNLNNDKKEMQNN